MTEMIERVARALCRAAGADPDVCVTCESIPPITFWVWENYTAKARAAIEAMRVPTREMLTAGENHTNFLSSDCNDFLKGWRAAIDAALEDSRA
jgi:hypothetical protein